ncbi:NAD(P)-binding protein [Rhizodiscina lignyota]|uniref:NAD(P)-binding protein n=1 Tax=Rhizodiscina lignyota TaxID=1504668 RepID=A0A9P4I3L1_9PEZI|nr:NAD(P)-binding protein [Rhizodiscina lignyota]
MSSNTPVWLITASSSGFGRAVALEALKRGHEVIATARNPSSSKLDGLRSAGAEIIALDVTSPLQDLQRTIAGALSIHGRIDILVNAAGFILEGALEECTPEESLQQFNTNVFGTMNVSRAVLPYMRAQHSGVIANFGSVGSWRGSPGVGMYETSKWAVSGLTESMRPELEEFGIKVTVIEPGYFRTGFLNDSARVKARHMDEYKGSKVEVYRQGLAAKDNKQANDAAKGAERIVDVLTQSGRAAGRDIPLRLPLGTDAYGIIKAKCEETVKLMDEWKEIICGTEHD